MSTQKKLHLLMTADSKQVETAAARVEASLKRIESATAGLRGGMAAIVGGADPFESMKGTVKNLIAEIPYIGPALQSAVNIGETAWNKLRATQKEMLAEAKQASAVGASVQGYSALSFASGDTEVLSKAMWHLSENAAKARNSTSEEAAALRSLGINAQDFANLSTDKQVLKLADAFKLTTDAGERNMALQKLLGKSARELAPTLAKGSEGLKELETKARQRGLLITDYDVTQLKKMDRAIKDIDTSFEGVWRRLTINLAPAIERFAKALGETDPNKPGNHPGRSPTSMAALRAEMDIEDLHKAWKETSYGGLLFGGPLETFVRWKLMGSNRQKAFDETLKGEQEDRTKAAKEAAEAEQHRLAMKNNAMIEASRAAEEATARMAQGLLRSFDSDIDHYQAKMSQLLVLRDSIEVFHQKPPAGIDIDQIKGMIEKQKQNMFAALGGLTDFEKFNRQLEQLQKFNLSPMSPFEGDQFAAAIDHLLGQYDKGPPPIDLSPRASIAETGSAEEFSARQRAIRAAESPGKETQEQRLQRIINTLEKADSQAKERHKELMKLLDKHLGRLGVAG